MPRKKNTPRTELPPTLVDDLLLWYAREKRDLPWRKTRDPYAIWISEMMLQQTLVATATGFYERWMARFPNIETLAAAPLDDVLKQWQGLGYYARARNIHKAAKTIADALGGMFPTDMDGLRALPGIGPYTAGAIGSIALNLDVPLVDANVIRVLCRLFAIEGDPKSSAVNEILWKKAAEILPSGRAGEFNQSLMELGALHCVATPRCERCPVARHCAARRQNRQTELPQFAPRPVFTIQTDVCAIVRDNDGRFLLSRRPAGGLWEGLHEMPRVTARPGETVADAAIRAALEVAGLVVEPSDRAFSLKHGVTTRKITLVALTTNRIAEIATPGADSAGLLWVAPDDLATIAVSSPQARLLEKIVADDAPKEQLSLFGSADG